MSQMVLSLLAIRATTDNSPLEYQIQKSIWPVSLNGKVGEENRGAIIVD